MPLSPLQRHEVALQVRHFELACLEGAKSGDIHGELHLAIGHEAVAAGMAGTLRVDDSVVSTHRNHGHALAKGVDSYRLMAEIFERATGLCGGFGGHMHIFDQHHNFSTTGIVGASLPVALGQAYAAMLDDVDSVAVAAVGDGGVNTGAFHETLNLAGALKLPFVVVVENNNWAISVPSETVSAAGPAERSAAYGVWQQRVDGTDAEIVGAAFGQAVDHARAGNGPAVLEATCARFRGHYEGDPQTYRSEDERRSLLDRDPIVLGRARLLANGTAADAELDAMEKAATDQAQALLVRVRQDPMPAMDRAFDHVFTTSNLKATT